jgi:hypothetical protein
MAANESKRSSVRTQPAYKRRKTSISRLHRFKDVTGKPIDFVEVYVSGDYHCIDLRFQDKTALTFVIDLGFTIRPSYSNWKTGNWRPIKSWPLIHSF